MKLLPILIVTALIMVGCSRSADGLYSDGKKAEQEKQYQQAADSYEQLVSRFSTTSYAESSLVRLSVLYNNELKDPRKALSCYQRFCTLFPSSKETPTMLFLAGFVYNNDLHLTDSARIVYESFLQQYPNHELAQSAKFELETLGKDPDQALSQRVASTEPENHPRQKKAVK